MTKITEKEEKIMFHILGYEYQPRWKADMKLNIQQLIEHLSLNIDDIILEVFKKDVIVFNSFWDDTGIEKYLKKKVKYFIAHYDSKNYGDKYVLTVDI